jgi:hypothetical protein
VKHWQHLILTLALIIGPPLAACHLDKPPAPTPIVVGGSTSTGGAPSTGGASTGGTTAALTTPEERACANMLALGCPEGTNPKCASDMARRCLNPKVRCDTNCLMAAATKNEIQTKCHLACGGL